MSKDTNEEFIEELVLKGYELINKKPHLWEKIGLYN